MAADCGWVGSVVVADAFVYTVPVAEQWKVTLTVVVAPAIFDPAAVPSPEPSRAAAVATEEAVVRAAEAPAIEGMWAVTVTGPALATDWQVVSPAALVGLATRTAWRVALVTAS